MRIVHRQVRAPAPSSRRPWRARLELEALESRLTPTRINVGTSPTDIPLGNVKPNQTVQIRAQVSIDQADQQDPSEGEGFVKMTISGPGFPSVTISDYSVHTYTVNVSQANEKLTAQLINPPNSDGDEGVGSVEVLPSAKVQVGNKQDKSDNIVLYNAASNPFFSFFGFGSPLEYTQKIPVFIYNTGDQTASFDLSVQGGGTLDQSSVSVSPGTPAKVMFTPTAVSGSVDDVHVIAKYDGIELSRDDLTVVSVTFKPDIYNSDTPQKMIDQKAWRIPPGTVNPTSWHVTVTPDLTGNSDGQSVTLLVDNGGNGANGSVNVDGSATEQIYGGKDVALTGTGNTAAGSGGNLKLTVQVDGQNTAHSDGFSVAAIPMDLSQPAIAQVRTFSGHGTAVSGFIAYYSWRPDSMAAGTGTPAPADLSNIKIAEWVIQNSASGIQAKGALSTSNFTYNALPLKDNITNVVYFTTTVPLISDSQEVQGMLFNDAVTGANGIPVPNSGYQFNTHIVQTATNLRAKINHVPMAVTLGGVAFTAGIGPTQSDDQFYTKAQLGGMAFPLTRLVLPGRPATGGLSSVHQTGGAASAIVGPPMPFLWPFAALTAPRRSVTGAGPAASGGSIVALALSWDGK